MTRIKLQLSTCVCVCVSEEGVFMQVCAHTFCDIVSEEAVIDFGALTVLTHRKRLGA